MPRPRADQQSYAHFQTMTTRWRDNDVYGHMNNVVFYEYVDTIVNTWLIDTGALDIPGGPCRGLVVETRCTYHASLGFPDRVRAGLRIDRIGRTSITYGIGLFREDDPLASAEAVFTHVYVEAETQKPMPLPQPLRAAAEALLKQGEQA